MNRISTYLTALLIVILTGCSTKEKLPSLRETYGAKEKKPFGGFVAHRMISNCFPNQEVEIVKQSFKSGMKSNTDTGAFYCSISSHFFTNEDEVEQMLDYVYRGNVILLASAYMDTVLMNKLFCGVGKSDFSNFAIPALLQETSIALIEEAYTQPGTYSYFYLPFNSFFSTLNDRYCRIIGTNAEGNPNCIVFFWGKGKLFLHTEPRAFSNYFLLTKDNHKYFQQLLQLMPVSPEHIYWNEYYAKQSQPQQANNFSGFSEIKKHPPLLLATWLLAGLLLVYILFGGKRRQRIIRESTPNKNSSLEFTESIARLYLLRKDNRSIAEKMISHFNEHIRSHYFITTAPGTVVFLESLSRKTGISLERTTKLYQEIALAGAPGNFSDQQLLSLHEHIQEFYKKRKEWKNSFSENKAISHH